MKTFKGVYPLCFSIGSTLALFASIAQASVQVNLGGPDLTNSPPSASVPNGAITLLFENTATVNTVKLTIDVTGTSTKVKTILFNVDPLITGLSFANVSGPTATTTYSANAKGMGGPLTGFDISFAFATGGGSNGALWNGSDPAVFTITKTAGATTLTENSFSFTNPNSYVGAVHINLPNGSGPSGKYGSTTGVIPEPGTFAVWGFLAMAGYFGTKKSPTQA